MDDSPTKILVVDDVDYNIIVLKRVLEKSGYQVVEADSGYKALEIVEKENLDLVLLDVMMPGLDGFEVCRRLRTQEKTRFLPIVMVTALTDKEHKVIGLDSGADDFISKPFDHIELTARVRSLLRIKKQREEIEAIKQDFTAMLVHDLRSPLLTIRGFIELLKDNSIGGDEEKRYEFLGIMNSSSSQMLGLINNILDISQLEAGKMTLNKSTLNLKNVVEKVFKQLDPIVSLKNISMKYQVPGSIMVDADEPKISQVLMNLLNNAIKFTSKSGEISLDAEHRDEFIAVSVSDTGKGIAPEELPLLFKKYQQTKTGKTSKQGTGLGLAISNLIVETHGGSIEVESNVNKGTCFTFTLPKT